MEFPELGDHCSLKTCRKLDFLPMHCDGCDQFFCSEHFSYRQHSCPSGHKVVDYQVPVCPLCGEKVPTAPDTPPDLTVTRHIEENCPSERKQIYTNRCSVRNCKKRELVPVKCQLCHLNFCLVHRHSLDHNCQGEKAGRQRGAVDRAGPVQPPASAVEKVQGNMSEDEALARALFLSMQDGASGGQSPTVSPVGGENSSKDRCHIS